MNEPSLNRSVKKPFNISTIIEAIWLRSCWLQLSMHYKHSWIKCMHCIQLDKYKSFLFLIGLWWKDSVVHYFYRMHYMSGLASMTRSPDIKDTSIWHRIKKSSFVLSSKWLLFLLPPRNNTVVKLLYSNKLIPPRNLFVTQTTTRGLSETKHYSSNPDSNTLTPDGLLTRHVVL